ncbi:MAG: choice-of-anchor B family protein [Chitinophagales bacterium]|nr:choice-of-anchor B family protein [Chitinophagales bacterium]
MKKLLLLLLALFAGSATFAQNHHFQFRSKLEFPGQTLANVCGWASSDGREYALVGGSKGLIIVDITNPDQPAQIVQLPGPDNLWKEIKTYKNYAYVTSEGGQGVQIVDLNGLPSANLTYHNYRGDGAIANQLNTIHALHIDTTKGYLYLYGTNLFQGAAVICDLNADPYNPVYAGQYTFPLGAYVHDGFADNDTLYAAHISAGYMSIVDVRNKTNPVLLGAVKTPAAFTHNTWILKDRKHVLTTDETGPSFLTSYDVSNPDDPKELDRYTPTPGSGSIGHNTHVLGEFAITSWYTDGVVITDVSRPGNIVETAWYDTWAGTGPGFDGCWGTYPFFPSGTIIASNIEPAELFILTPNYVRACFLEGTVRDENTGALLNNVNVNIALAPAKANTSSNVLGQFKTGLVDAGAYDVTFSLAGYESKTLSAVLQNGELTLLNVLLKPLALYNLNGNIVDAATGQPIPNAGLSIQGPNGNYNIAGDASGQFALNNIYSGQYKVIAGIWGYVASGELVVNANANVTIALQRGYYDDFALDLGWSAQSAAATGQWVRAVPNGTTYENLYSNPNADADGDSNNLCYVTGNAGNASQSDVDNGSVTLSTPAMKLASYTNAELRFKYWFFNNGGAQGSTPNDQFEVLVTNGIESKNILTVNTSESAWRSAGPIMLADLITLTDNVQVLFRAADNDPGHLVEAGVDIFSVTPIGLISGTDDLDAVLQFSIVPNPSASAFTLLPGNNLPANAQVRVLDAYGKTVLQQTLSGSLQFGSDLPAGVYFVQVQQGRMEKIVKL